MLSEGNKVMITRHNGRGSDKGDTEMIEESELP